MDNKSFGNFILELRNEKKLTQQELANMIPIGREAISKWERGKNYPDIQSLMKLSEIFNIGINELLYGERKNKDNNQKIENVTLELIADRNKKKKIIFSLLTLLVVLILLFLSYYFVVNFNSLTIYKIDYNDIDINLSNGIVFKSNDKIYFNLGNIKTDKVIEEIEIYWLDNSNKKFIMSTNNRNIFFYDLFGYEEYFDFERINDIFANLYLKITFDDNEKNIKLNLYKIYSNNKLFLQKNIKYF